MKTANIVRETNETSIDIRLSYNSAPGAGGASRPDDVIDTGCGFLNHMLTLFASHGRFRLSVKASGDIDVDYPHLTEDIAIALGKCFSESIGDGRGIIRYGSAFLPMDETLVLVALDISGRAYLSYDVNIPADKVGDFDTELAREFMLAFSRTLGLTLHIKQFSGLNAHHIIEAIFKGLGRAMRTAVSVDSAIGDDIPSSKGALFL